jgi:hypothetical protein
MADELFPMRWAQVDFRAGTLYLAPGTTKNKDGRLFPFAPELRAALEASGRPPIGSNEHRGR